MKRATVLAGVLLFCAAIANGATIETFAGGGDSAAPPLAVALPQLQAMAVDAAGNYYFTTEDGTRVWKLDTSGHLTIIAGTGVNGTNGEGGPAAGAEVAAISAMAFDSAGNLYLAERTSQSIRKIDAAGNISRVAGRGNSSLPDFGNGGPAIEATFQRIVAMAIDSTNTIYVSDGERIRKIDSSGIISVFAGQLSGGSDADGIPALNARFRAIYGIAVDSAGNLYVGDSGSAKVRKISQAGIITTAAGTGVFGSGGDGGPALQATLSGALNVAITNSDELLILDFGGTRIRKVDSSGTISRFAGTGSFGFSGDGLPATQAQINPTFLSGIVVAPNNDVVFADSLNNRIRKIGVDNVISTIAGNGTLGFGGDGGSALQAGLYTPYGTAIDSVGNVYIADWADRRIRKVDLLGNISTFAGTGRFGQLGDGDGGPATAASFTPNAIAIDSSDNLYIADYGSRSVRKITPQGTISTIAGNGGFSFSGDGGPATEAGFFPHSIAVDGAGILYIVDGSAQRVRKVDASGVITTVAGNGQFGSTGVGGPATGASLMSPMSAALDAEGNLYIGEYGRLSKVSPGGDLTVVVGPGFGSSGDGGLASNATVGIVHGIAVSADGVIYVSADNRVRRIATNGIITRVAGTGATGFSGDGGNARNAKLAANQGIALDSTGDVLYIADTSNHRVRKLSGLVTTSDQTPPQIQSSLSGTLGQNGWYVNQTLVTWTVSDEESDITSSQGCFETYVGDTAGHVFTCTATSEGGSNSVSVTVKQDSSPPSVNTVPDSMPNAEGWYQSDVSVEFVGTDYISGVDHCDPPAIFDIEGEGQTKSGTCTDMAGNVSAPEFTPPINLDKTPPQVQVERDENVEPNGGWFADPVTFFVTGSDTLSGIAPDGCDPEVTMTNDGADQTISMSCHDRAGLSSSQSVSGINIDLTRPVATVTASPAAFSTGWWNSGPVTVSFSGTDSMSGSGIQSCTASQNVEGEPGRFVGGACVDVAGNTSSSVFKSVQIDQTPPSVQIVFPEAGANYDLGSIMQSGYVCHDLLSGIQSCTGTAPLYEPFDTSTVGTKTFTATAVDRAFNSRSATVTYTVSPSRPRVLPELAGTLGDNGWYRSNVALTWAITSDSVISNQTGCQARNVTSNTSGVTYTCSVTNAGGTASYAVIIKRDANAPTSTLSVPANNARIPLGTAVTASYTCADTVSGIASCAAPAPNGALIDTASVGTKTFTVLAKDNAGNTFSRTATYIVVSVPTVTPTITGTLGANGWYTSNVSLSWSVTPPPPGTTQTGCQARSVNGNNVGVSYTCSATNAAGSASQTVTIKRDSTPPTSAITVPVNNASYAIGQVVQASYNCAETTSDVATCVGTAANNQPIDTASAGTKTFTVIATNSAGLTFTRSVTYTVAGPPTVTPTVTGTLGNNGWYTSVVTVTWALSSPITSQTGCGTRTVNASTAGITYTCSATNVAGTTSQSVTVKRDSTPPTINLSRPANNGIYARNAAVTASFTCADPLSGLVSCVGTQPTGSAINTSVPGTFTFTVNASDAVGNISTVTRSYTVQ